MRGPVKLVRNGNSTQITIPKPVLHWLGWACGNFLWFEVLPDKSLLIRSLRSEDSRVVADATPPPMPREAVAP